MSNDNFQDKFKGQIQIMGKGGISSIGSTQAINEFPSNNNINMNQQSQNMINMNYPNMNYNMMSLNQMNNQNSENDFSGWNEIYNNEQKLKGKKDERKMSRIKSGGEMVMSNNKNKIESKPQKPTTPNLQFNNVMNNQFNPQMMMNNPNFVYQQQMSMMNPNFYQQQIPMNNSFNDLQNNNMNMYNQSINVMNDNINKQPTSKNNNNVNKLKNKKDNKQIENKKQSIESNNNSYHYVEYKPHTLKEYRELQRTPIVMGPLGANIGTKEWEEKKEKMRRRENYSNRISLIHKGITKLKKDNPKEEREKDLKRKYERSSRYKSAEYCRLIQSITGNNENTFKISLEGNTNYDYNNLGAINEKEELKNNRNKNITESNYYNENPVYKLNDNYNKFNDNYNQNDLQTLLQQNESYRLKIENLKDTLF